LPLPEIHRRICDWLLEQARRELNDRDRVAETRPMLS
jgi:hypothetical protein